LEKVLGHARILGEPPPLLAVMASAVVPSVSQVALVLNSISCILFVRTVLTFQFSNHTKIAASTFAGKSRQRRRVRINNPLPFKAAPFHAGGLTSIPAANNDNCRLMRGFRVVLPSELIENLLDGVDFGVAARNQLIRGEQMERRARARAYTTSNVREVPMTSLHLLEATQHPPGGCERAERNFSVLGFLTCSFNIEA
jgi:hypothetical protein